MRLGERKRLTWIFCFIKESEIIAPARSYHFCLTLFVWMIPLSIYRPQNTLPLTFYSCENQSRVHLISLGRPLKPPKHPCFFLLSMLLARVGLILLQRTFLSMLLIAPYKSNCPFFLVGVYRPESSADIS